jgi:hypothetical protein
MPLTSGFRRRTLHLKLFRRVHKMGKAWGEKLTEKTVWHVVREYAAKAGIERLVPMIYAGPVLGCAMMPEANWSRSSFCSVTSRFRQPSDILAANSTFAGRSMTKSE